VHHDPTFLKNLWDNAVAAAAIVALILTVLISARTIGILNRPKHWLRSTYLPPRDLVGFFAMPHFLVEYENRGNVPVVFSDFVLHLPRIEGVIDPDGKFIAHPGADLFIDKRPTTRWAGQQIYRLIDFRTNTVRLGSGDTHTDFFDLGAFAPNDQVPDDFHPILTFHDNYGNNFYADEDGVHRGAWKYPHRHALEATLTLVSQERGVETRRRAVRWLGWVDRRTRGTGEAAQS
jgi:hypothetical protein